MDFAFLSPLSFSVTIFISHKHFNIWIIIAQKEEGVLAIFSFNKTQFTYLFLHKKKEKKFGVSLNLSQIGASLVCFVSHPHFCALLNCWKLCSFPKILDLGILFVWKRIWCVSKFPNWASTFLCIVKLLVIVFISQSSWFGCSEDFSYPLRKGILCHILIYVRHGKIVDWG